ncbi:MAG: hypothetical protein ACTH93_04175 [Pseudoclavibacter sp.]
MSENSHTQASGGPDATPDKTRHWQDQIWQQRSGLWWGHVPAALEARLDQLAPGEMLRVTAMNRDSVLGSIDLCERPTDALTRLLTLPGVPRFDAPDVTGLTAQFRTQPVKARLLRRTAAEHLWHLDFEQLKKLMHYDHFIPLGRGFSQRHIDEVLPGLLWGEAITLMCAADVWLGGCEGPRARVISVATCRPTVRALHVSSPNDWLVEWNDDWMTEAPVRANE